MKTKKDTAPLSLKGYLFLAALFLLAVFAAFLFTVFAAFVLAFFAALGFLSLALLLAAFVGAVVRAAFAVLRCAAVGTGASFGALVVALVLTLVVAHLFGLLGAFRRDFDVLVEVASYHSECESGSDCGGQ